MKAIPVLILLGFSSLVASAQNYSINWFTIDGGGGASVGAGVTEYYNRHAEADGSQWFTVTTVVDDPKYLNQPFITSTSFRKEPDGSKWNPSPCRIDPPRGTN